MIFCFLFLKNTRQLPIMLDPSYNLFSEITKADYFPYQNIKNIWHIIPMAAMSPMNIIRLY